MQGDMGGHPGFGGPARAPFTVEQAGEGDAPLAFAHSVAVGVGDATDGRVRRLRVPF